jgi:protein-S-isoprenylcysteine O-methyltransferase Ste14
MAAIVVTWFGRGRPGLPFALIGIAPALAGLLLVAAARSALGASFTVFPKPRGPLVAGGPYRFARHPIYGGGLLFFGGVSLGLSWIGLGLTVVLAVLWWRKSLVEERNLEAIDPGYADYRRRTPHRFFPLPWPRGHAP